ncbi:MAG: GNAT family N-acetyltransferase [Sulfolobales archaeon]
MVSEESLEIRYTSEVIYVKFSDGSKAYLIYKIDGDKMILESTYTPPQHRGKGVAKKLVDKAIEIAREKNLKIVPVCSYSVYYFMKYRETRDMLAEPYKSFSDEDLKRYYEERLREEKEREE